MNPSAMLTQNQHLASLYSFCRRAAERRPTRAASQRPTASQKVGGPAPVAAPSRPIITEVDSEEEAEPEKLAVLAREEPVLARTQRAAAAAAPTAAAPAHSDDDSEDEGRQVRSGA